MSDMPMNYLNPSAVADYHNPPNKMRSQQEIVAKYNQNLETYRQLCFASNVDRQQKLAIYTEIKVLGWVLRKPEKSVIQDITANSNKTTFPKFEY